MHRNHLLEQLELYASAWPEEAATVERYATFVKAHTDCFERSLAVGHVTGSAWVVNAKGTHVLLTHHKKLDRWLQLGGHVDGNPDVLESALREVEEESGITEVELQGPGVFDIDIHLIPERGNEAAHYHYDIRYAFKVTGDETFVVSDESHDLCWVPIAHLEDYTSEASMIRMAVKWINAR
jgi:8-oxo-dGTP pyrophosphatase MutT (NUDIX family)